MASERICVGKIVSSHGIRGEVTVLPWTDFPQRFRPGVRLLVQQGEDIGPLSIAEARDQGRKVIIKFKEIEDADAAEALRGAVLMVEPWEVEPLPEGHYYHFQLVGCSVYTTEGEYLGILSDILTTGSNDVYVVRNEREREILIPALKTVVREIRLAEKKIYVELLPGLL